MRGAKEDVRLFKAMFGDKEGKARAEILYARIVAAARDPHWYVAGGVPDTIDGRFDMIALHAFLVIQRVKREPEPGPTLAQAVRKLPAVNSLPWSVCMITFAIASLPPRTATATAAS